LVLSELSSTISAPSGSTLWHQSGARAAATSSGTPRAPSSRSLASCTMSAPAEAVTLRTHASCAADAPPAGAVRAASVALSALCCSHTQSSA
jgi:hypothetical protein